MRQTPRSDARYFVLGQIDGCPNRRYAILGSPHTVVEIVASRPDGVEVPRPATFRIRLASYFAGEARRPWFNNVPPMATKGSE